jgi:hypothetical protein
MKKPNVAKFAKDIQVGMSKHSPEILTTLGITGMVATTVLAVKATPKAMRLIDEKNRERDYYGDDGPMPKLEVVKTCWKCYAPAVLTGLFSAACLIGANSVNARRNAALATAYKLSETALIEYRDKVLDTVGEKKEQTIRDKVAREHIEKNPVTKREVIVTGNGKSLCFDPYSSRYFESDIELIRRAENTLNKQILHDICGTATLNEFYDEIGLPHTEIGDDLGWNTDNLISLDISSHIADDGRPSLVIGHYNRPQYDY